MIYQCSHKHKFIAKVTINYYLPSVAIVICLSIILTELKISDNVYYPWIMMIQTMSNCKRKHKNKTDWMESEITKCINESAVVWTNGLPNM